MCGDYASGIYGVFGERNGRKCGGDDVIDGGECGFEGEIG